MPMMLNPESTYKTCPVMPLAPSEARKDAVSPTSWIVTFLLKATLPTKTRAQEERYESQINLQTSRPEQSTNTNANQSEQPQKIQPIKVEQKAGRNERVTITNGSETRELKWKKAQPLVESGKWTRI